MVARSMPFVGLLAIMLSGAACAQDESSYENWLVRVGDYETLYRSWWWDARSGDLDKQERVVELLLGPHGRETGAKPYEGAHFLYGLAINGRRASMLRLATALDKGAYGFQKRPDAARCWSAAPSRFDQRLACVGLTGFRDSQARLSCMDIMTIAAGRRELGAHDAKPMARLCLANKTPSILVPGLPPAKQSLARIDAFKRYGIDWTITGDVYNEEFEAFRSEFNHTMIAAIDGQRGTGYFDRLAKDIEARVRDPAIGEKTGSNRR